MVEVGLSCAIAQASRMAEQLKTIFIMSVAVEERENVVCEVAAF